MASDLRAVARTIVREYLAHGIPARSIHGSVYIRKEDGWEGPLDPSILEESFRVDIRDFEERVSRILVEAGVVAEFRQKTPGILRYGALLRRFLPNVLRRHGILEYDSEAFVNVASAILARPGR